MKDLNQMTPSEIQAIPIKVWNSISPFKKRSCYDCKFLDGAITWWCTNKEAIEARGTQTPGCIKCPYWQPDWSMIHRKYKTAENGYVKPLRWYQRIFKFLTS